MMNCGAYAQFNPLSCKRKRKKKKKKVMKFAGEWMEKENAVLQ